MNQYESGIEKSTMHSKIIGNMGENLVCNWLSRKKFEVAIVDHTGIDVIASNPQTKERLGITVKSRARGRGKEKSSVNLFRRRDKDEEETNAACQAFGCEPCIAVYVETKSYAELYLTKLDNYNAKYKGSAKTIDSWKMSQKWQALYDKDNEVMHLHVRFEEKNWF